MSAHPIEWHQQSLENMRLTAKNYEAALQAAQETVYRIRANIATLEYQIKEANAQGKKSFDQDKFCRSRK